MHGTWLSIDELADPAGHHLNALVAGVGVDLRTDRRVAASFFLHSCTWRVARPAISSYVGDRRVPDVGADNVLINFDERGRAREIAFRSFRCAARNGERSSDRTDLTLFETERELIAWLHSRLLDSTLRQVIGGIRATRLLGLPAMWGNVSDTCADAFVELARATGDPLGVLRAGENFFGYEDSPIFGKTGLFVLTNDGKTGLFYRRASCCLIYKAPGREYCDNCILLEDDERKRRLLASLAAA